MKEFSVMILCYNPEKDALRKTIDSVLVQKGVGWELILADDCSGNGCLEFAKEYLEGRGHPDYKVMAHEKNVGTVQNIYDAIQLAEGRYIKCIGAGDLLLEDTTLKKVYDYMQETSCTMCFGKMQAYRMNREDVEKVDYFWPPDIGAFIGRRQKRIERNVVRNHGWIPGASMFYDTAKFKKGLEEITGTVKYCEDLLQVLLLVHQERIAYFPCGTVYYEMGSGISTNNNGGNSGRMQNDHKNFWEYAVRKYPGDKLVRQGYRMYRYEGMPQANRRRLTIIVRNPGYVLMLIRTLFQHKLYTVSEDGLL